MRALVLINFNPNRNLIYVIWYYLDCKKGSTVFSIFITNVKFILEYINQDKGEEILEKEIIDEIMKRNENDKILSKEHEK